jgi:hypothetical protein
MDSAEIKRKERKTATSPSNPGLHFIGHLHCG